MGFKTDNLSVGQVVPNYKKMCELLGVEVKNGGKSKQLQVQEWECYFRYTKDKNKYIITEIYENPKQKADKRKKGNNNKYGDTLQKLLIKSLLDSEGVLTCPISQFLLDFNIVNVNFRHFEDKIFELASILEVDNYYIYEFYNIGRNRFKDIFECALKKLEQDKIIKYNKIPTVSQLMIPDKVNFNEKHREATIEEIELVETTEIRLLEDMGYKNINQLMLDGKLNDYRHKLSNILSEKGNIEYIYYVYNINLIALTDVTKDDFEVIDTEQLKDTLNNIIINSLIKNAENRYFATIEKTELYSIIKLDTFTSE